MLWLVATWRLGDKSRLSVELPMAVGPKKELLGCEGGRNEKKGGRPLITATQAPGLLG